MRLTIEIIAALLLVLCVSATSAAFADQSSASTGAMIVKLSLG